MSRRRIVTPSVLRTAKGGVISAHYDYVCLLNANRKTSDILKGVNVAKYEDDETVKKQTIEEIFQPVLAHIFTLENIDTMSEADFRYKSLSAAYAYANIDTLGFKNFVNFAETIMPTASFDDKTCEQILLYIFQRHHHLDIDNEYAIRVLVQVLQLANPRNAINATKIIHFLNEDDQFPTIEELKDAGILNTKCDIRAATI